MAARLLWVIMAVLAATPAVAETRHFAIIRAGGDAWTLIDPNAIERDRGGVVLRTWTVTVQRSIVTGLDQPGYVRTLRDFDCNARQTRWRKFMAYARNGELVLSSDNPAYAWSDATVSPEVTEALGVVCSRRFPALIAADNMGAAVIALMRAWDPPAEPAAPAKPPGKPQAKPPMSPPRPKPPA